MWLFIDNNREYCSNVKPEWNELDRYWMCLEELDDEEYYDVSISMPKGSIKKLTGLDTIVEPIEYI